jgi:hypothetical protein
MGRCGAVLSGGSRIAVIGRCCAEVSGASRIAVILFTFPSLALWPLWMPTLPSDREPEFVLKRDVPGFPGPTRLNLFFHDITDGGER